MPRKTSREFMESTAPPPSPQAAGPVPDHPFATTPLADYAASFGHEMLDLLAATARGGEYRAAKALFDAAFEGSKHLPPSPHPDVLREFEAMLEGSTELEIREIVGALKQIHERLCVLDPRMGLPWQAEEELSPTSKE